MGTTIKAESIAPCGFNCMLCAAHQKKESQRGYCAGCNGEDGPLQKHCFTCQRKNCRTRKEGSAFCFDCEKFPCRSLRELDARYQSRCNVSMIENLVEIREKGMEAFLEMEQNRWTCPVCGELLCLSEMQCLSCGHRGKTSAIQDRAVR